MRPSDYPPEIRAVFDTFTAATGAAIRLVGCVQAQQATNFVAGEFQLWELRLVIAWLKARISECEQAGRGGFSQSSLKWENVFGTGGDVELTKFQSHLGVAMRWNGAKSFIPRTAAPAVGAPKPQPAQMPVSDEERARLAAKASAMLANLKL